MKTTKKLIAFFLSVLMLFTMVSNTAFAVAAEETSEPRAAARTTISIDSYEAEVGETINADIKVENYGDAEGEIKLSVFTTPLAKAKKQSYSLGEVAVKGKVTKEFSAVASDFSNITNEKIREVLELVVGNVLPQVFRLLAIFIPSMDCEVVKIGNTYAAVVAVASVVDNGEVEEPTEPEEPEKITHTVSFDLNYEGAVLLEKQTVKDGEYAVVPEIEEREGYQFIGWYTASGVFDFSTPIKENIELTARWFDENDNQDSDNDGLNDSLEEQFGTDSTSNDTDNDGVSDYNELNWLNSNPNNINNGSEDYDEDGLTNAEEDSIGTNLAYYDSDYDYISDYDEIHTHKTNPLLSDTDGDGVIDGIEIQNGSDPLNIEEEFVTTVETGNTNDSNPVTASASVTTDSEGAGSLKINEVSHKDDLLISPSIPGYLGSAYDFETDGNFVSATITLSYDTGLGEIGEDFQPRIYYVNEETGMFEELPNQTVENGKVSVTVEHFSKYILLNKVEFDAVWSSEIKPPEYEGNGMTGIDVVFVVDSSGSMDWNDETNLRHEAVKQFVDKLGENDRAAIIDFDSYAYVYQNLTNDKTALKTAVNRIDSSGGTNLSNGMNAAINIFTSTDYTRIDAYKYIIFLTDGDGTYSSSYTTKAANNNIVVYTIGLGDEVEEAVLKAIASGTNGKYYFASIASVLPDIYNDVSFETIDYVTDSNSDGISDYYTDLINNGDLLLSNGANDLIDVVGMHGSDCADWDNDGLLNGEEITINTSGDRTYIHMKSHPCVEDSDGDGISDYVEVVNLKTNPLKITKAGASSVENLIDGSLYVYVEQVNDTSVASSIAGFFDWQKTGESKETFINYFYDYASEDSINKNSEAIEKLADREEAWKRVETVTNIVKLGKSLLDLGTDLNSYDSSIKGLITKYENKHKDITGLYNKKSYKEIIEKYSDVDDYEDAFKAIKNVYDVITKDGVIEKSAAVIAVIASGEKLITSLKKVKLDLGKKINSFSNKYQTFLGKRPTGDITYGTAISVGLDAAEIVTEVASLNNLYGKLQSNSEAFNEYIELIEHVSINGNDKDYIKVAAGDIVKVVLDKTDSEYYKQLNKAIANNTADNFINIALSIAGDFCPYVKVAEMVIEIVKISLSLTGMTAYAKSLVKSQCIDAISDGCIYYLSGLIDYEEELWFSYSSTDEERVYHYLTQLAQSRIVGEESMCSFLKQWNLASWVSKIISGTTNEELDQNFETIIKGVYNRSKNLGLVLSSKLPRNESSGGGSR